MEFYHHNLKNIIDVTSLITVHYFKYAKDFKWPGETHDFYELVYADSGRVHITNGADGYTLAQGQAFLHMPDVFHNIQPCDVFSNIIILTFTCADAPPSPLFDRILTVPEAGKALLSETVSEAAAIFTEPLDIPELRKMTLKPGAHGSALQIIKGNIEKLLLYLSDDPVPGETAEKTEKVKKAAREQLKERIEKYLEDNLCRKLTLADVSRGLNYSVPYLKALFPRIIARHTELKIERAKELIAEGNLNFKEISELLSFSSPNHFSTAFRKSVNMSPSEFEKSVKLNKLLK